MENLPGLDRSITLTNNQLELARQILSKVGIRLLISDPFFSVFANRIGFVVSFDKKLASMSTDGVKIYYSPWYVLGVEDHYIQNSIVHEVLHIIMHHPFRMRSFNHNLANAAADYVVNYIIKRQMGRELRGGVLYDRQYENMSVEQVYALLKADVQEAQEKAKAGSGDNGNSPGDGGSKDADNSSGGEDRFEPNPIGKFLQSIGYDYSDGEIISPSKDGVPLSADETDKLEFFINSAIHSTAQQFPAGELPGIVQSIITDLNAPKVDWKIHLADFFKSNLKNKNNWLKPKRRYLPDIYIPKKYGNGLARGVIMIDSSGSVNGGMLKTFFSELKFIVQNYITEIAVLIIDDKVCDVVRFDNRFDFEIPKASRRGGTSFRPGFDWVNKNEYRPDWGIYLTDGECSYFPEGAPEYPFIWFSTGKMYSEPPFGKVVIF